MSIIPVYLLNFERLVLTTVKTKNCLTRCLRYSYRFYLLTCVKIMLETLKIGLVQFLFGYLFIVGGFLSYFILFILYPLRWVGLAKFYRYAARSICYFHFPSKLNSFSAV